MRAARLLPETVLEVEATVVASEQAPGGVELHEPEFRVLAEPAEPPPIELRRPGAEGAAADAARPRAGRAAPSAPCASASGSPPPRSPASARRSTGSASRDPDAEDRRVGDRGRRERLPRRLLRREAFLAQSPQFYKQTMVGVFERVYEVGPVFRAEPHETARHLAEYVSLDAELGFIRDHCDVMRRVREAVAAMVESRARGRVRRARGAGRDPFECTSRAPASTSRPLARGRAAHLRASTAPSSCSSTATRWRSGRSTRTPSPGGRSARASFDLLFRGLEIVTGGQRLHRYEDYVAALAAARRLDQSRTTATSGVPLRDAAARRLRPRPRALGRQAHRRAQHPRDHVVPSRSASSESLASRRGER